MFETENHNAGFEGEDRSTTWTEASRPTGETFPTPEPIPPLTVEPDQAPGSPELGPEEAQGSPDSGGEEQADPGEQAVAAYLDQGWAEVTGEEDRDRFFIENGALVSVASDGRRFEQAGESAGWVAQIIEQGYTSFEYQKNGKREVFLTVLVGNELVSRVLRAPEREQEEPAEAKPTAHEAAEPQPAEIAPEAAEAEEAAEPTEPEPTVIDLGSYFTAQAEAEGSAETPSETVLDFRELFQGNEPAPVDVPASLTYPEPVNKTLVTREPGTVQSPQPAPPETAETGIRLVRLSETSPKNEPITASERVDLQTLSERAQVAPLSSNPENLTSTTRDDTGARANHTGPKAEYQNVAPRESEQGDLPAREGTVATREPALRQPLDRNRPTLKTGEVNPVQRATTQGEVTVTIAETMAPGIVIERGEVQGDTERSQVPPETTSVEPITTARQFTPARMATVRPSGKPVTGNWSGRVVPATEQSSQMAVELWVERPAEAVSQERPVETPQAARREREQNGQPQLVRVFEAPVTYERRVSTPTVEQTRPVDPEHRIEAVNYQDPLTKEQKTPGRTAEGTERLLRTLGSIATGEATTHQPSAAPTETKGQAGSRQPVMAVRPVAQIEGKFKTSSVATSESYRSSLGEKAIDQRKVTDTTAPGGGVIISPKEPVLAEREAQSDQTERSTVPHLVHRHTQTEHPTSRQTEHLAAQRTGSALTHRTELTRPQKPTRQVLNPGERVVFTVPPGKAQEHHERKQQDGPAPAATPVRAAATQAPRRDFEATLRRARPGALAQNDQTTAALPHQPAEQVRSAA